MSATNGSECVTGWPTRQARQLPIASEKISAKRLYRLLELQGFKCAVTGRDLTPETASLDHKVPLSQGGSNLMDNVQIVHWDVNKAKGTMTMSEFLALCKEVVAFADESHEVT